MDGYAITSDENIIHVRADAKYLISEPVAFKFDFLDVENLLRNALNNALLYATAHTSADDALYRDRVGFKDRVRLRFLNNVQKAKLGIKLQSLDVRTFPPMFANIGGKVLTSKDCSLIPSFAFWTLFRKRSRTRSLKPTRSRYRASSALV